MSTILNISNRLPVVIDNGKMEKSSGGLVSALEGLTGGEHDFKWIGWTGRPSMALRNAASSRLCWPMSRGSSRSS